MESEGIQINNTPHPRESLEVALKGLSERSKALAGNIANVNTPNYKRREVSFEETLKKVQGDPKLSDIPMKKTNPRHFSNEIFSIDQAMNSIETKVEENDFFINGNNVDIEREMVELTKTGMRYKAITNLSKKQYDSLRSVVRGG
jgi:flagellar basal-body rod protein FlgB